MTENRYTRRNGRVFGLAPRHEYHEYRKTPQIIFHRKMSAQETLLEATRTYVVLDVKSQVGKVKDEPIFSHHQVSVGNVWVCSSGWNVCLRLELEQNVESGWKAWT